MSERPLEDQEVKYLVIDLLTQKSKRDKQRTIGPSGIGDPCDYCLGVATTNGQHKGFNHFWMGARIGTAIHETLEKAADKHVDKPMENKFNALEGALLEGKVRICVIEGYGMIQGSADLVLIKHDHLIDYKTTTRAKMKSIQLDPPKQQYVVQQQLYMHGLNINHGIPVKRASLAYICRDGSSNGDVFVQSFDYDPEIAEHALERLEGILAVVGAGNIEDLASHPDCWTCNNERMRG